MADGRGGLTAPADVLVVGAWPAGLAAALQAHDHGATVRVVDRRVEAFRAVAAMIVHPRTLECLRPLGVTDELLERGDISPRAELHLGRRRLDVQLAGLDLPDTAHTHSPAGAQGMNTGIQDAINLGWKLAYAAGDAQWYSDLLDSYDQERRPVARRVLAMTHLIFCAEASTLPTWPGRVFRSTG